MTCTCGLAGEFATCCGPRLARAVPARTAEELMRTRYAAYVHGDIDYLWSTQAPEGRASFDREAAAQWSRQAEWLGLEVLGTSGGGAGDADGTVEFVARYRLQDEEVEHHEIASFRRDGGVWLFVDGGPPKAEPFRRKGRKVGANETCPCGSGKKFKKCCARKPA